MVGAATVHSAKMLLDPGRMSWRGLCTCPDLHTLFDTSLLHRQPRRGPASFLTPFPEFACSTTQDCQLSADTRLMAGVRSCSVHTKQMCLTTDSTYIPGPSHWGLHVPPLKILPHACLDLDCDKGVPTHRTSAVCGTTTAQSAFLWFKCSLFGSESRWEPVGLSSDAVQQR